MNCLAGTFEVTWGKGVVVYTDHSQNGTYFQRNGSPRPDFALVNASVIVTPGDSVLLGSSAVCLEKRKGPGPNSGSRPDPNPDGDLKWAALRGGQQPQEDKVGLYKGDGDEEVKEEGGTRAAAPVPEAEVVEAAAVTKAACVEGGVLDLDIEEEEEGAAAVAEKAEKAEKEEEAEVGRVKAEQEKEHQKQKEGEEEEGEEEGEDGVSVGSIHSDILPDNSKESKAAIAVAVATPHPAAGHRSPGSGEGSVGARPTVASAERGSSVTTQAAPSGVSHPISAANSVTQQSDASECHWDVSQLDDEESQGEGEGPSDSESEKPEDSEEEEEEDDGVGDAHPAPVPAAKPAMKQADSDESEDSDASEDSDPQDSKKAITAAAASVTAAPLTARSAAPSVFVTPVVPASPLPHGASVAAVSPFRKGT